MFRTDYFLYMNEAEDTGLFTTKRKRKLNKVVDDFIEAYHDGNDINDYRMQNRIYYYNNIDPLPEELSYIKKTVERRIRDE